MTLLHVRAHHLHRRAVGDPGGELDVAEALTRADLPEPEGMWFIDRLDARVSVSTGLEARVGAELLAQEIARAVRVALSGDRSRDGVRWFPDRATYLAQWLTDLSTGRARGRWEYAQFGAAEFSPAMRDRALAEPGPVLEALRSLPVTEIDRMAALLTPEDAATFVHAITSGSGRADRVAIAHTVAALWRAGRLPRDPRRATALVLLQTEPPGNRPAPGAAAAARDLVQLCVALRDCDPDRRAALLAAARRADVRTLTTFGHGVLATALTSWPRADLEAAVAALAPEPAGRPGPDPQRTTLGGLFLLLPLLAELPLGDATVGWPPVTTAPLTDAAALTGALALGAVLGVGVDILTDPWALLALGLPPDIARRAVPWSDQVTVVENQRFTGRFAAGVAHRGFSVTGDLAEPSLLLDPPLAPRVARSVRVAAAVLLRELSHRLPGQARAGVDHVRRNVLASGATVRADDDAIVVALDPPPLDVLLSLTGMNRRRFTLPATGERPWVLTPRS